MGTLYYGDNLDSVMRAFMEFLGPNDMMAYLAMMAPRLVGATNWLNFTLPRLHLRSGKFQ